MSYTGLDKPKGRGYFLKWRIIFIASVIVALYILYQATSSVDYHWQWNRIPQYFWISEQRDFTVDFDGSVVKVDNTASPQTLTVTDDTGQQRVLQLPPRSSVIVDAGTSLYYGDTVARYHFSKPGVLVEGLVMTVRVSIMAIIVGIALGLFTGLCRISENPCLRWWSVAYVELIRGTPLMVQIFIWYFVIGVMVDKILMNFAAATLPGPLATVRDFVFNGLGIPPIPGLYYGVIALAVFTGAYVAEIVRAGIQSVHRGQTEAARSLGMSYGQAMRKVILPQAMRRILPPLAGQFISLIKDSSLLGVMAVRELTKATREAVSSSVQPLELWFTCALLYLLVTFTLSLFVQYLERRAVMR